VARRPCSIPAAPQIKTPVRSSKNTPIQTTCRVPYNSGFGSLRDHTIKQVVPLLPSGLSLQESWRREWDSNSEDSNGTCKLQILHYRECRLCHKPHAALPTIGHGSDARTVGLCATIGLGCRQFEFEWDETKAVANARKHGVYSMLRAQSSTIHSCSRLRTWSTAKQKSGGSP